jgi:quercetin dioxygenase-like cupin family protein
MTTLDPAGLHVTPERAEVVSYLGMDAVWLVTRELSAGSLVQFLQIAPPGTGVPMHILHTEHESLYVLDGELVARCDDHTFTCRPGDSLLLPKGVPHAWRSSGDVPARILFTFPQAPGSDWETMLNGLVGLTPADFPRLKEVCAANDIEFVEPVTMP